ncbi:MAG: VIT1/CCC1 transporter family protein [Anaerolineales bacterium]|jgi:VIT1/CCC1 family predicted Fe2+/Mn2+ transporter/rubrerythrin
MTDQKTLDKADLVDNWRREVESADLYRKLIPHARTDRVREGLAEMAEQEDGHAQVWQEKLKEMGVDTRRSGPDLRIRMILWLSRVLGADSLLSLLVRDEVNDIGIYVRQAEGSGDNETFAQVLKDETSHATFLRTLHRPDDDHEIEPWHQGVDASGWLRSVVYGFNDGLTANFGLVMGVVGANITANLVLLTGFAGLLADALSMASSAFLAGRSEQEVREHHLRLERAEITYMPDHEREELKQIYMGKGLSEDEADQVASALMKRPEAALAQLAADELGLDIEASQTPLQEGVLTGIATGFGAVIPIIPFIFLSGPAAIWLGIGISMLAHFAVGASRAIFTGRPAIRSGFEMFLVGMGVAVATFVIGRFFGVGL